jgi:hypothetical protein
MIVAIFILYNEQGVPKRISCSVTSVKESDEKNPDPGFEISRIIFKNIVFVNSLLRIQIRDLVCFFLVWRFRMD